jgi:hypothetical protein
MAQVQRWGIVVRDEHGTVEVITDKGLRMKGVIYKIVGLI